MPEPSTERESTRTEEVLMHVLLAGATGAVKTVKMSAKLVSGRAPDDPAPE